MSSEILERFTAQFIELFSGDKRFIWHGGEPLLAGLDFFHNAIELQKKHQTKDGKAVNYIQTNGTLINDDWALFFKQNSFRVGISLDGCRDSHDRFRLDLSGKGSFDLVMKGISCLRKREVEFGLLMTLTKGNLPDLEKNLDFIRTFGCGVAFNDYEITSSGAELVDQGISQEDAMDIWRRSLAWWLQADDPDLRFRLIDNVVCGSIGHRPSNCTFNGSCHHHFCLQNDGEIYPCDRMSLNKNYCLGNLEQQNLEEILVGDKAQGHKQRVQHRPPECTLCKISNMCNNGCTALRDTNGRYVYCESRKQAFEEMSRLCNRA